MRAQILEVVESLLVHIDESGDLLIVAVDEADDVAFAHPLCLLKADALRVIGFQHLRLLAELLGQDLDAILEGTTQRPALPELVLVVDLPEPATVEEEEVALGAGLEADARHALAVQIAVLPL